MDEKNRQPDQKKPSLGWGWWIILIALLVWNVIALLPKNNQAASIPYSTFLDQVKQGNVKSVKISGSSISGVFNNPVLWPPATSVSASPTSQPQVAATPVKPQSYTQFQTTFPETVGDPNLMPLLTQNNVQVDVIPPPSPWLTILLSNGLPFLLLILVLFWVGRQATSTTQSPLLGFGRSKARRYVGAQQSITFADVADAEEAKRDLQEVVDFLRHPEKYHKLGAHIPRGILLIGPPGTGKTLLAKAVAGEAGVPYFSLSASEFVEMFVGVGASRVRDLFTQAKSAAPSIVFIDELDAVGRRRGAGLGTVNDEREQTLNQLLVEMDGFDERHEVIVLASTNRPDVLDPALLRPGRFDRQVVVNLPDKRGREGILKIHTRDMRLAPDVDLTLIATTSTGLSGADLANLCNEAALIAARRNHEEVSMSDFEEALDRVLLGEVRPLLLDEHERRVIAYHESGHALVAWLTPIADPVYKVTIIPRGRALGVTEQLPGKDMYNYSREYLLGRLAVMLGGRAAEEIALGDITTGAENDLVQATRLARYMVTRWGMGSLGLMAFQADEEHPFLGYELSQGREYSEETASTIDRDVRRFLDERYRAVLQMLKSERKKLDDLVALLLKEETVERSALEEILGPRTTIQTNQPEIVKLS